MSRPYVYQQFALAEHFASHRKEPLVACLLLYNLLLRRGRPDEVSAQQQQKQRQVNASSSAQESNQRVRCGHDPTPIAVPVGGNPSAAGIDEISRATNSSRAREHAAILAPCLGTALKKEEAMARVRAAELLLWGEHGCCAWVKDGSCVEEQRQQQGLNGSAGEVNSSYAPDAPAVGDDRTPAVAAANEGETFTAETDTSTRPPISRVASQEAAELAHHLLSPLFTEGGSAHVNKNSSSSCHSIPTVVQGNGYFFPRGRVPSAAAVSLLPEAGFTSTITLDSRSAPQKNERIRLRCVFAASPAVQRAPRKRCRDRSRNGSLLHSNSTAVECAETGGKAELTGNDEVNDADVRSDDADEDRTSEDEVPVFLLLKAYVLLSAVVRRGARTMPSLRRTLSILNDAEKLLSVVFATDSIREDQERLSRSLHRRFLRFDGASSSSTEEEAERTSDAFFEVVDSGDIADTGVTVTRGVCAMRYFMQKPIAEADRGGVVIASSDTNDEGTNVGHERLVSLVSAWWAELQAVFHGRVASAMRVCKALLYTELSHVHCAIAGNVLVQSVPTLGAYIASTTLGGTGGCRRTLGMGVYSTGSSAAAALTAPAPLEVRARVRELTGSLRALRLYAEYFTTLRPFLSRSADPRSSAHNTQPVSKSEGYAHATSQAFGGMAEDELIAACAMSLAFFRARALLLQREVGLFESYTEVRSLVPRPLVGADAEDDESESQDPMVTLAQHLTQCAQLFSSSEDACNAECRLHNADDEFALLRDLYLCTDVVLPAELRAPAASVRSVSRNPSEKGLQPNSSLPVSRSQRHWVSAGLRSALGQYIALHNSTNATSATPADSTAAHGCSDSRALPIATSAVAAVKEEEKDDADEGNPAAGDASVTEERKPGMRPSREIGTADSPRHTVQQESPSSLVPFHAHVARVERRLTVLLKRVEREMMSLARDGGCSGAVNNRRNRSWDNHPTTGENGKRNGTAFAASVSVNGQESGHHSGRCLAQRARPLLFSSAYVQGRVLVQVKVAALLSAAGKALTHTHYVTCVRHLFDAVSLMKAFARYVGGEPGAKVRVHGVRATGGHASSLPPAAAAAASCSASGSSSSSSSGSSSSVNNRLKIDLHLLIASLAMHLAVRDVLPALEEQQRRTRRRIQPARSTAATTTARAEAPASDYFSAYDSSRAGGVGDVMLDVGLPYFHLQAAEELYYASPAAVVNLGLHVSFHGGGGTSSNNNGGASTTHNRFTSALLLSIKLMKALAMYQVAATGEKVTLTSIGRGRSGAKSTDVGNEWESECDDHNSDSDGGGEEEQRQWRQEGFTKAAIPVTQRYRCSTAVGEVLERLSESYAAATTTTTGTPPGPSLAAARPPHPYQDARPTANPTPPPTATVVAPASAWTQPNVALFHLLQALYALTESKDEISFAFHINRFLCLSKAGLGVHNALVADALQLLASALRQHTHISIQQQHQRHRGEEGPGGEAFADRSRNGETVASTAERGLRPCSPDQLGTTREEDEQRRATALARHASQRYNGLAYFRLCSTGTAASESEEKKWNVTEATATAPMGPPVRTETVTPARYKQETGTQRETRLRQRDVEAYSVMQTWRQLQLRELTGSRVSRDSSTADSARRQHLLSALAASFGSGSVSDPSLPTEATARQFLAVLTFLPHTPAYRKLE